MYVDKVKVGDAAQTTASAGFDFEPTKNSLWMNYRDM